MEYVSITKLASWSTRDSKFRSLEKETRFFGLWAEICSDRKVVIAETLDVRGEAHSALLLHGGFPLSLLPPYVGSKDLEKVVEGVVKFTRSPLEAGVECLASLRMDAGGRGRVDTPLRALEEWSTHAAAFLEREARREADKLVREAEQEERREAKAEEWVAKAEKARAEREAEAERVRATRAEREAGEAAEKAEEEQRKARAIAAWEAEEKKRKAEEEARRKAMEERRLARAEAKVEEERARFVMFWVELACVAELILEQRRAQDPLRPLREQGGEVVEITTEGWEVWEYPAGRYAEAGEAGEVGEAGEGSEGESGGVAVHEVEADLPYILNVRRLHVCEDRRAWEDARGFWVVTGDSLSLHLVTDLEIALAILRKEWRVREAQEFRGEGYIRKVRRQEGWDGRLERVVEELG